MSSELHEQAESSPEAVETPPVRRRSWRKSRWFWLILVVVGLGLLWPAWWGVHWYGARSFRLACEKAHNEQAWYEEQRIALEWVAWDPDATEGWVHAAIAAQELDDLIEMARCIGHIPDSYPNALGFLFEKANVEWTALNRPLDAIQTSQRILKLNPSVPEIHARLISYYALTLQRVKMLKAIRRAIDVQAEPREAYSYLMLSDHLTFANGDDANQQWMAAMPDVARFKISMAVQTAMNISARLDVNRTDDFVRLDREAMLQLVQFLKQHPHDPVLLPYLMYRTYQVGDVARIGELLEQVDEQTAEDHMVWVFRGWYHTNRGEFEEAEQALRQAIQLNRSSPLAHHEYANLLRKLQREDEVAHEQELAALGREARSRVLHSESSENVSDSLLQFIMKYTEKCEDYQVSDELHRRLNQPILPGLRPQFGGRPGF